MHDVHTGPEVFYVDTLRGNFFGIKHLKARHCAVRKILRGKGIISLITIGFILISTTPIIYISFNEWKDNDYYLKTAEIIAWALCFIFSMLTYIGLIGLMKVILQETLAIKYNLKSTNYTLCDY